MKKTKIQDSTLEERYPKTFKLGVLLITPGGPRVHSTSLAKVFSENEAKAWEKWYGCSTLDNWGIYAWDVEDFLQGRPNLD